MSSQSIVVASPEVLPPDVDTRVRELQRLDGAEAQARQVTVMLSHARTGLLAAIAAHDLPSIVEFKAKAAAIQEIAKQVRLGKDMQLDAAEFVRRAERGLGVAIREGQARGDVLVKGEPKNRANQYGHALGQQVDKSSPTDFAPRSDLSGNGNGLSGIYNLTDGITDSQFEEALAQAKDEGNLSRANVARKCKAKAQESVAIPDDASGIDATVAPNPDTAPRPFKKSDSEMLAEIVGSLANFAELIKWVRPNEVTHYEAQRLATEARTAWRAINKQLKEIEK